MTPNDRLGKLLDLFAMRRMALARAVNVDSSLVSKWSSGKRKLDVNSPYLLPIARAFAAVTLPPDRDRRARHIIGAADDPVRSQSYTEKILHYLLTGTTLVNFDQEDRDFHTELSAPVVPMPDMAAGTEPAKRGTHEYFSGVEGYHSFLALLEREIAALPPVERVVMLFKADIHADDDPRLNEALIRALERLLGRYRAHVGITITQYHEVLPHMRACRIWRGVMLDPNADLRLLQEQSAVQAHLYYEMIVIPGRLAAIVIPAMGERLVMVFREPIAVSGIQGQIEAQQRAAAQLYRAYRRPEWEGICRKMQMWDPGTEDVRIFSDGVPSLLMPTDLFRRLVRRAELPRAMEDEVVARHEQHLRGLRGTAVKHGVNVLCSVTSVRRMLEGDGHAYTPVMTFLPVTLQATRDEVVEHLRYAAHLCRESRQCRLLLYDEPDVEVMPRLFHIVMREHEIGHFYEFQDVHIGITIEAPSSIFHAFFEYFDSRWDRLMFHKERPDEDLERLERICEEVPGEAFVPEAANLSM